MRDARDTVTCHDVEELLPLVADHVLDCDDDPALFEHLARCPDCQRSLGLHDLTTLALASERTPVAGEQDGSELIRLPWPLAAAGGAVLAAAGVLLAWTLSAPPAGNTPTESPLPDTQVVEVRTDADGNEIIVLMRDGELIEVRSIDRDAASDGPHDDAPVPVGLRR